MIYLDYSTNTPVDPRVAETFPRANLDYPGNPNFRHPARQAVARALADIRIHIVALPYTLPGESIFAPGATEANDLMLSDSMVARRYVGHHIVSTTFEHPPVSTTLGYPQEAGYKTDLLPILPSDCIDLNTFSSLLRKDACLASLSAADSELGIL